MKSRRRFTIQALLGVMLVWEAATASTPLDALQYRPPSLVVAQERLAIAQARLTPFQRIGYSAKLSPQLIYSDTLSDEEVHAFLPYLSGELKTTYRYNLVQDVIDLKAANLAQRDLNKLKREGVRDALYAHVALLRAQVYVERARFNLDVAQKGLREAEALETTGEITPYDLLSAELVLNQAQLDTKKADVQMRQARGNAAKFGLQGRATYQPLRFALPDRRLETIETYIDYNYAVAQTEAELLGKTVFNALENVTFGAAYSLPEGRIGTSVGIIDNLPGADLTYSYPGSINPYWEITLKAEFVLTQDTVRALRFDHLDVVQVERTRNNFSQTFNQNFLSYRQNIVLALEGLNLAEQSLKINRQQEQATRAELVALRASLNSAIGEELSVVEAAIESAQATLERVNRDRYSAEDTLYSFWNDYLRQVDAYLILVDGMWVRGKVQW